MATGSCRIADTLVVHSHKRCITHCAGLWEQVLTCTGV